MTDKRRKLDAERRQPINRLVAPETVRLLKSLAGSLQLSEGRVLDRAVQALAVAESFGGEHLQLDRSHTMKTDTYADGSPRHCDPRVLSIRDSKRAALEVVQPRRRPSSDWFDPQRLPRRSGGGE